MYTTRFRRCRIALLALWLGWTIAATLGMAPPITERTLAVTLGGVDQPLRGQEILLLDAASQATQVTRTDAAGRIHLPASHADTKINALYQLDEQPHRRYQTYLRGNAQGGQLAFDPQQTLMTFPVTISLEWQPGKAEKELANLTDCGPTAGASSVYTEDVAAAMQEAAAYLYDLTDGQMTFGDVTIYTGGEKWQEADIRILANNDYRPTALIGGIVDAPTTLPNADGSLSLTFRPGQIFLGRLWDGTTGRCGPWSADAGVRTIVHEWLHYALNLWDEYHQPTSGGATYCASDALPLFAPGTNASSAMAYHYTANALWNGDIANKGIGAAPASCIDTDQMLVHNRSDWETIKAYFPTITMPNPARGPLPGPVYSDLINVDTVPNPSAPAITSAAIKLTTPITPELKPESYLLITSTTSPIPRRIIGQGALWPEGQSTFFGVQAGSTARIQVTDLSSNTRLAFPKDDRIGTLLKADSSNEVDLSQSGWQTELHLIPVLNQAGDVIGLRVQFSDCQATAKRVQMVYCPAGGDCGTPVFVSVDASGLFEQVLTAPGGGLLPFYGYIYVRDPERGLWTTTWYQLGGGVGPAHADGHVPLADGLISTNIPTGTLDKADRTATLYMPAQRCLLPLLPPDMRGPLSQPLEVQFVRGQRPWTPNDPPISIRLNYDQDLATRLGVRADDLALLTFEHTATANERTWQETPVAGRDGRLGWLSADVAKLNGGFQPFDGRLLLTVGYRTASGPEQNQRLLLPGVRKT